jgi:hypothetical protein
MRLIAPEDRAAFRKMLQMEMQGRELPNDELRQVAERTWHKFLKFGWPRAYRVVEYPQAGLQLVKPLSRRSIEMAARIGLRCYVQLRKA